MYRSKYIGVFVIIDLQFRRRNHFLMIRAVVSSGLTMFPSFPFEHHLGAFTSDRARRTIEIYKELQPALFEMQEKYITAGDGSYEWTIQDKVDELSRQAWEEVIARNRANIASMAITEYGFAMQPEDPVNKIKG
jgi:hypothetical protein